MQKRIITLGACCDTTIRLHISEIRNENSIFEWMQTFDFADILKIMHSISQNHEVRVIKQNGALFYENTKIRTRHYKHPKDLHQRFVRRRDRLIQWIRESQNIPIVFVRHDVYIPTTNDQIQEFCDIIRKIDPESRFEFVLLTPPTLSNNQIKPILIPKRKRIDEYKNKLFNDTSM
jgi:hypothetical protein